MQRVLRAASAAALLLVLISPAQARSLATFGMCLARTGTTFYGASWCPQCRAQRELLGSGNRYVRYVECSVSGRRERTDECRRAGVTAYPTWDFPDGSRETGRLSVETLAARSGCPLEHADDRDD